MSRSGNGERGSLAATIAPRARFAKRHLTDAAIRGANG